MIITKSNKILIFCSFIGLAILIFKISENFEFSLKTHLQLISCYILIIICIIIYCIKLNSFNYLPLLPLTCLYFLTCYISIFFFNYPKYLDYSHFLVIDIPGAINILFLGISFFVLGFYISKKFFQKFNRKGFKFLIINEKENLIFAIVMIVTTIIFFYIIKIQILFNYLAQIKFPILLLSYGLLTRSLFHQGKMNKVFFCIISLKLLIIFFEILSGSYAFPFMLIFLDITYLFYLKKKINIFPIILITIFVIFIHLGKDQFRDFTWNNNPGEQGLFYKMGSLLETYDVIFDTDNSILNKTNGTRTLKRVFHSFESLVIVTKKSPNEIPFWDGYSYQILISKIVPRIFWRDKPSDTIGNEFGHRYQILTNNEDYKDTSTSWNMPVLNEFYVNFGKKGVILGMFLLGVLFNLITIFFSIPNLKNIEHTINYYLFIPVFFMESHLSLLFGALLQSYLFLLLTSFLFIFFYRYVIGNK